MVMREVRVRVLEEGDEDRRVGHAVTGTISAKPPAVDQEGRQTRTTPMSLTTVWLRWYGAKVTDDGWKRLVVVG